jgi:hypothetical protein
MKPMSERKMDMSRGEPDSDGYFPESAHHRKLAKGGEIARGSKYPDTEELVHADTQKQIQEASRGKNKDRMRH